MSKIAVVTDTNSGITREEAKKLGVYLLPMPFIVDGTEYFEGVTCTYEHFFEMLEAGAEVSTSQPSPESLTAMWEEALATHDSVVHIPMSSALSGSCDTAKALAAEYNGRVCVVDNKRISITQRQDTGLTMRISNMTLAEKGLTAAEICVQLESTAYNASIYLAVNTLELLKKSGRVTPAGAALATLLGLKPVLQIQGGKLDAYAKVRGMANAEKAMLKALEKDLQTRFAGKKVHIAAAYSGDIKPALEWRKTIRKYFDDNSIELYKLPISICCHVSSGVKALGCFEYFE